MAISFCGQHRFHSSYLEPYTENILDLAQSGSFQPSPNALRQLLDLDTEHDAEQRALALLRQATRAADGELKAIGEPRLQVETGILLRNLGARREPQSAVAEAAVHLCAELDPLEVPTGIRPHRGSLSRAFPDIGSPPERVVEPRCIAELPVAVVQARLVDPIEGDVEAEPEIEEDDDLLEPDFEKLGRPVRRFEQEDNELEALIDADFDAEDEDELEILMLQELGIEIGDDHDVSFSSIAAEPNETDGFDDDMAA